MTIAEIYIRVKNPPTLQEHMLKVAKVALFIYEHWKGPHVDKKLLVVTALLHDVGNIVKFDIEKYPTFLGDEKRRVQYWIEVQKEMIQKYGTDDHVATKQMLIELKVEPKIIKTILEMSYWNALRISKSDDWTQKILLYADLRVGPKGIISLKDRLNDIHTRLIKYKNRKDLYEFGIEIERQIQEYLNIEVFNITDINVEWDNKNLLEIPLEIS